MSANPKDQAPPWLAFPGMRPEEFGATQGAQEAWLDGVWRPFWLALGEDERARYLDHWHCTRDWREWIALVCEMPADFDAAQDAAEAEGVRARVLREGDSQTRWIDRFRKSWRRR